MPGGRIDGTETPWECAIRELAEETTIVLDPGKWKLMHEFQRSRTRFYVGTYTGVVFKGDPRNKEVAMVELPRAEAVRAAIQGVAETPVKCGSIELPLRRCMWNVLKPLFTP